MKIRVENTYSDGYESTNEYLIDDATVKVNCEEDLEDFLHDLLYSYTGDGHGIDSDLGSYYTVTILESDRPELVGYTREWD